MAIVKVSNPEVALGWNKNTPFPKDNYPCRCISSKFANSNAGNPMITLEWEICWPNPVQLGDRKVNIDGLKITTYHNIQTFKDGELDKEATESAQNYFGQLLKSLGYEDEGFDDENPPHAFFRGKVVDAIVYGKKQQSFKEPTPEERAMGKKVGAPIKDPSGKEAITYQLSFEKIFGLSSVEVARPY